MTIKNLLGSVTLFVALAACKRGSKPGSSVSTSAVTEG